MVTDGWLPGSVAWLPIAFPSPLCWHRPGFASTGCYTGVLMKCCRMPWLPSLQPSPQA